MPGPACDHEKWRQLVGQKFGLLTVADVVYYEKGRWFLYCVCDCGGYHIAERGNLLKGHIKSCGCLVGNLRHGHTRGNRWTPEYRTYTNILTRCLNKNRKCYSRYGGRNIKVCDRWLESFENFFEDMGKKPGSEYSIDRIDNNGDYCLENCRWATKVEQARNKRTTLTITFKGETKPLKEWTDQFGIRYHLAWQRIYKHKWPLEQVFNKVKKVNQYG